MSAYLSRNSGASDKRVCGPHRSPRGARVNTYDREALDNAVDRLSGRINHPDPEIDLPEFGPGCGASELYRRPMSKTTLTPFNEETAARP
jgi:hypothetical protein